MSYPILFRNINLTLIDLYNVDDTIFSEMTLPEELDLSTFIDNLLFSYGILGVSYTNPNDIKTLIKIWSKRRSPIWERLYKTTQLEYDPIENYNREEEYTDTRKKDNTGTDNRDINNTVDGTITRGTKNVIDNTYNDNSENTVKATAFNSNDLKTTNTQSSNADGTSKYTSENSGTDTSKDVNAGTDNRTLDLHESETLHHEAHLYGNIGVTTSQQMIKEEREVSTYDIYAVIMADFAENFLILVY